LIIADIVMPTMDGYEFARQVRADPEIGGTQIIFYTSSLVEAETRRLAQACGVSYILTKPSEPEVILETVNAALNASYIPPIPAAADDFHHKHMRLLTDTLAKKVEDLEAQIAERIRVEEALRAKDEELQAMTQQLWQTAKLATMGKLAAEIAHELNNPLTAIGLRTELLQADIPVNNPSRKDVDVIAYAVAEMRALVSNLLQSSRRSQPQKSAVDIRDEIEKTLALIDHHLINHRVTALKEIAQDLPWALADRQQIRQVLLNLFTNASDAMPEGGTLTVRGYTRPTAAGGPLPVVIEITDTGEGIPPEILSKVWESFFTTKAEGKGTGLGLAICRRIMEEHGGTIEIESEGVPGKGTTVRLRLPYAAEQLPQLVE
jgi:signal transduction histidine kinase